MNTQPLCQLTSLEDVLDEEQTALLEEAQTTGAMWEQCYDGCSFVVAAGASPGEPVGGGEDPFISTVSVSGDTQEDPKLLAAVITKMLRRADPSRSADAESLKQAILTTLEYINDISLRQAAVAGLIGAVREIQGGQHAGEE